MSPPEDSEKKQSSRTRGRKNEVRPTKPLTANSITDDWDGPEVSSRTAQKRERVNNENALAELATDLAALSEQRLRKLNLPELVLDSLLDAKKIKSAAALGRQLRQIRSRLRDVDWLALRAQLDLLRAGYTTEKRSEDPLSELAERLLIQGDAELRTLVDQYPSIDAGRLRQLVRNVQKAAEGKRAKARGQLHDALGEMLPRSFHTVDLNSEEVQSTHDHPGN